MLEINIIESYSKVHNPHHYTNNNELSFDGSQRQSEFFTAWNIISSFYEGKNEKLTFLEVGAWKGLWGMAFAEFCKQKGIEGEYVTITMIDHDPNNQPLYKTLDYINKQPGLKATLIDLNTFDENALTEVTKDHTSYNIVFMDAGHKYYEAKNDIDKFGNLATDMLIFHDIRPVIVTENCGVYQAIVDSNIVLDEEISVVDDQMGIGIKFIK
jgi:hypothetical protein|tara:strand:+ start:1439 stop:2074 length:636 start_codon:yes stop_codon:yes gene_type:complete